MDDAVNEAASRALWYVVAGRAEIRDERLAAVPDSFAKVAVVGAGVVGALTGLLLRQLASADVTLVDVDPARAAIATRFGLAFAAPDHAPTECDLVVHASATAAGLATALAS